MQAYEQARSQGVRAFAQVTGRQGYWRKLERWRASFLDPSTGEPRRELVEDVSCAACGESHGKEVFRKHGFRYVRCEQCGMVFISPQLTGAALLEHYRTSEVASEWLNVLQTEAQMDFDRRKYEAGLDLLGRWLEPDGKHLLDVGCGIGLFLALARQRGFTVRGIDPVAEACRLAAQKFGVPVDRGALETAEYAAGCFDVVSFWEVLEHLKRPAAALRKVHELLRPAGYVLLFLGGNAHSLVMRVLRERCVGFDFTRLWYFTPPSIRRLLEVSGFEMLHVSTTIPEIDVILNYLRYDDPYAPELPDEPIAPCLADALRKAVIEDHMGYKLLVVARRVEPCEYP